MRSRSKRSLVCLVIAPSSGLRALGETVQRADVREEKANLLHAIYERIVVAGPEIIRVSLTSAAYARGLALALPEKVVMARPTGVGRSTRGPEARESSGAKRRQVSNERSDIGEALDVASLQLSAVRALCQGVEHHLDTVCTTATS